ncbi:MAG: hypothetical protein A4E32_01662 [Methanomassiliicoccales archaeon PtaU1.Bin124]|nr:MAG: hypothetical protein A4E32_01662 [Methanomassiliicoccales archaeon PtaU1.Bin124]
MNRILLRTRYETVEIELDESDTSNAIYLALPLTKEVSTWGGEVYFEIPVEMPLHDGKKVMEVGEVAYWPEGKAFCIFFGRTPFSKGTAPEAYSMVTPIGRVVSNLQAIEEMLDRTEVTLDTH